MTLMGLIARSPILTLMKKTYTWTSTQTANTRFVKRGILEKYSLRLGILEAFEGEEGVFYHRRGVVKDEREERKQGE